MKKIMVAAIALSMLGGAAFAQNAPTASAHKKAVKKEAKAKDASDKKVEKKEATAKHAKHHAKHVEKADKAVEQSAE